MTNLADTPFALAVPGSLARDHPPGARPPVGAGRPDGVRVAACAALPTRHGQFTALAFTAGTSGTEHLALLFGSIGSRNVLTRIHSECLTGDVLGSLRCDCGEQLDRALDAIADGGSGVLVYLRGHEGRGIGLASKLRAYELQERGLDTIQANLALGLPVDSRDYSAAVAALAYLGIVSVRLLSNNPDKLAALAAGGIDCSEMLPMPATVTPHNREYLSTKADALGHRGLWQCCPGREPAEMGGVVGLGGGIGASRLWPVLASFVGPGNLTLVVNTGEDLWLHGLRICPDIDTVLYALAGCQDAERGWGLRDESFRTMSALRKLAGEVWFNLGDLDLATHLHRTGLLRDGIGLAEVTARLASAMGVPVRLLPMTEDEVTTTVRTADGRLLHYEEFLVKHQCRPAVSEVWFAGLDRAATTPGVLEALESAEIIVLGPSNPVASMLPILGLPGVRNVLRRRRDRVIAVSPIVCGVPMTDPGERLRAASRVALLGSMGLAATPAGVARLYRDVCSRFAYDNADAAQAGGIAAAGLHPVGAELLLHCGMAPDALLEAIVPAGVSPG